LTERTKLVRKEAAQLQRLVDVTRQAGGSSEPAESRSLAGRTSEPHLVRSPCSLTISGQYNEIGRSSHCSIVLYLTTSSEYLFSARAIAASCHVICGPNRERTLSILSLLRKSYHIYVCFIFVPGVILLFIICGDVRQSLRKFCTCPRSYTASMWRVASSPHCMNVEILTTNNRSCRALENLGHCPAHIVSCTPHPAV